MCPRHQSHDPALTATSRLILCPGRCANLEFGDRKPWRRLFLGEATWCVFLFRRFTNQISGPWTKCAAQSTRVRPGDDLIFCTIPPLFFSWVKGCSHNLAGTSLHQAGLSSAVCATPMNRDLGCSLGWLGHTAST